MLNDDVSLQKSGQHAVHISFNRLKQAIFILLGDVERYVGPVIISNEFEASKRSFKPFLDVCDDRIDIQKSQKGSEENIILVALFR